MRPQILFPLFAEVSALPGVGPRLAKLIEKLAGPQVVDLLWHLPSGLIDRRYRPRLAEAEVGRLVTLELLVGHTQAPRSKRQPTRVTCFDEGTAVDLVYFHAEPGWLAKLLPEGSRRLVSGKLERYGPHLQITHPDHVLAPVGDEPGRTRQESRTIRSTSLQFSSQTPMKATGPAGAWRVAVPEAPWLRRPATLPCIVMSASLETMSSRRSTSSAPEGSWAWAETPGEREGRRGGKGLQHGVLHK